MTITVTTIGSSEFILLNHHPDLARRPEGRPGLIEQENRRAALTWNVFRTLELIAPSFWLRRFRARLDALTSLDAGDRSLSVRLWAVLPVPGDRWRQNAVCVDALVETDTVYGVMTLDESDLELGDSTFARPDAVLRVIDAVSWYAGARDCYIALITSDWPDTPIGSVLIDRYRGSRDVLLRRLPHRQRDGLANVRGVGRMTWRDVAGIVRDCAESNSLTDLERLVATRTEEWLDSLGIHPSD